MAFLVIIALLLLHPAFLIIAGPMIIWMAVMMFFRISVIRKIFKNGEVITGSVVKVGKPKGRLMMEPVRKLDSKSLKGTYVLLFSFECNGKSFQYSTRIRFRPGMIEAKPGDEFELLVLTSKPKHFVIRKVWDEKA
jgi:hypothetical protein